MSVKAGEGRVVNGEDRRNGEVRQRSDKERCVSPCQINQSGCWCSRTRSELIGKCLVMRVLYIQVCVLPLERLHAKGTHVCVCDPQCHHHPTDRQEIHLKRSLQPPIFHTHPKYLEEVSGFSEEGNGKVKMFISLSSGLERG